MPTTLRSNFALLGGHDAQLVNLGLLAERYFADDPNTSLLKLRQLAELLAQLAASCVGLYTTSEEPQFELIRVCRTRASSRAKWRSCSARYVERETPRAMPWSATIAPRCPR